VSERVPRRLPNNAEDAAADSSSGRAGLGAANCRYRRRFDAAAAEYLIRRHRDMVGAPRNCNFKSPCDDDAELWATGRPQKAAATTGSAHAPASSSDIPFVLLIQSGRQTALAARHCPSKDHGLRRHGIVR